MNKTINQQSINQSINQVIFKIGSNHAGLKLVTIIHWVTSLFDLDFR